MPVNRTSPKVSTTGPYNSRNLPLAQGLRLSRSPHPYHRRSSSVRKNDLTIPSHTPRRPIDGHTQAQLTASLPQENGFDGGGCSDVDGQKRRGYSSSPSDSGTEADDESGVLRGLPAPAIRSRKGFRGSTHFGPLNPLLTPSSFDEDSRKLVSDHHFRHDVLSLLGEEESSKVRAKFIRRRQAELMRRLSETILLGSIGCIACTDSPIRVWKRELLAHILVLFGMYALYPLRISYGGHGSVLRGCLSSRFKIPADFDPAPLLYPTLIPVFVALLLTAASPEVLLPNLVLSIASIPRQVISCYESGFDTSFIHWFLSIIPILVSEGQPLIPPKNSSLVYILGHSSSAEKITLLYPLHQALLPSLGYLTTTSLLPAELQLLSVSMINVLVFAASPQAVILKALLWIGGLSVFILCGTVLKWEVALARVPRWRFRNPRRRSHRDSMLLLAIDDLLHKCMRKRGFLSGPQNDSDSDESKATNINLPQWRRIQRLRLQIQSRDNSGNRIDFTLPMSAADGEAQNTFLKFLNTPSPPEIKSRRRRHTLPSYVLWPTSSLLVESPKISRRSRFPFHLSDPRSFMSLTEAQAFIVKWSYALYVYAVVLIAIAMPIRITIKRWALHDYEPVGWALGYLLGNIPLFRLLVHNLGFENWIPLPSEPNTFPDWKRYNLLENMRTLGAGNIRLLICTYCLAILVLGLQTVFRLTAFVEVDTRRKVFHGMMVVMFLPSILIDPPFAALALVLVLAMFLLFDLFRASQLPPFSKPLTRFLAPYVDGRDHRGPVIVSHIFLLIGCAIPLWLSLAAVPRSGRAPWEGWEIPTRDLDMISGVVCVGMGDAAASLVGRRFGRRRWCWSGGKSLEGSLAFSIAVMIGLSAAKLGLHIGGWEDGYGQGSGNGWAVTAGKMAVAATGASLTEAVLTGGNDNVIVPVILWLLVRGLKI